MNHPGTRRRAVVGGLAGVAAFGLPLARAAVPPLPTSPVTLNFVDVAGNLALTQKAIEAYVAANPKLVSRVSFGKAPSPELPGKIRAQQGANRVDIDGVLTGIDALSAGIDQKLWQTLVPDFNDKLPSLPQILQPNALRMQNIAQGQGVCIVYCPAGPLLQYMPDRVNTPPTTPQELLDWARANPNRFLYARPANSGPGRVFMMGLPYVLGDRDPSDPKDGWDRTWAYLRELGRHIEYYPAGTTPTMKELGDGTRDMVPSQTGWDINPRALGIVPKEARVTWFKGFHWIIDAHFLCIPKGVAHGKVAVLVDLLRYLLSPPAQAMTYDAGYFYPGPAVKDVPLSMAPQESQDIIREFGRPEYDNLIANNPAQLPLLPDKLVYAFARWDEQIGAAKKK